MQCLRMDVEETLNHTLAKADFEQSAQIYWEQNECLILERFIPKKIVNPCLTEVELLRKNIFRNYVPGHKQGGSVSYYAIENELHEGSAIVSLYRSPALRRFLSQIVKEELLLCPDDDPHSCALYYYTQPGDHIGYHYDRSYYKGKRYTVLMGLIERSERCRLVAHLRMPGTTGEISEQSIPLDPGSLVIFNGDTLWHAVTPLGPREERIILTMQYVTDQAMGPFHRAFSSLKDAFAYFGPAALMHRPKVWRSAISGTTTSRSDSMSDHPTLQFLAGAGGASHDRDS
ncbi:MAG: 2OG-Fe(II) oxygenase [Nitrospira sp.]|nr:2OG-Fe(II) oxygenase [Nitrospira sp.]